MGRSILVVAPHPDDETLGCGGTLLRHGAEGDELHWVVVTAMAEAYAAERRARRAAELQTVARHYGFTSTAELGFTTAALDTVPRGELVEKMSGAFRAARPDVVYLPHPGDVHSDHRIAFEAAIACTKWFREPAPRRVLVYETLSETDAALDATTQPFHPNVFVDITAHLERKLQILQLYEGETGEFPFPRSIEAGRALARLRGAAAGYEAAEAFQLLRERL